MAPVIFLVSFMYIALVNSDEIDDKLDLDEIYVINLVRRPERYQYMKQVLEEQGLSVTFWPATDGNALTQQGLETLGVQQLPGYLDPYHKRPITMGEIGCFLSHYFIWKNMIENTDHEVILILEDDVKFNHNWEERYVDGMEELNWLTEESRTDQPDLIYLGRKILSDNEIRTHHNFVKVKYSYWTIGYIITRKGAQKLLDSEPLSKMLPIDEYLPIMYDSHPNKEWSSHFNNRNLVAISFDPVLITPTHYIGDKGYISDTEQSVKISEQESHPKYQQQNKRDEL